MPTLEQVKQQIADYPHTYIFWTWKEVRKLPKILEKDEPVKAVTSGLMENATWLLVCTDRRLIFLNCGMFYGVRQVQMPLDRIQSIDYDFTIYFGSIKVWDGASHFSIGMIARSSILPFVKTAEELMYAVRKSHGQKVPDAPSPATMDVTSQLIKLAELKDAGHLTQEEFNAQKQKLLSQ
jgi:hypothetical protein